MVMGLILQDQIYGLENFPASEIGKRMAELK